MSRAAFFIFSIISFIVSCANRPVDLTSAPVEIKPGYGPSHRIVAFNNGRGYFKERKACEAVIPVVTDRLNKYLGRKNTPSTVYRELQGMRGVVFEFLENAQKFSSPKEPDPAGLPAKYWAENLSLSEYSDLQITQYLSGALDRNLTNYLLKDGQIYAIDNDGDIMHFARFPGWTFLFAHTKSKMSFDFKNFPFDQAKTQNRENFIREVLAKYPDMKGHPLLDHRYRKEAGEYTWIDWEGAVWIQRERDFYEPFSVRVVLQETLDRLRLLKKKEVNNWIKHIGCPYKDFYLESFMAKKDQLLKEVKGKNGYRLL